MRVGDFKIAAIDSPIFVVCNWMSGGRISGDGGVGGDAGDDAGDGGADASDDAGVDAGALPPLRPYQDAAYVPFVAGAGGSQSLNALYPAQVTGGVPGSSSRRRCSR